MQTKNALRRLIQNPKGTLTYGLCRFSVFRSLVRQLNGLRRAENKPASEKSIFSGHDEGQIMSALSTDGFYTGLNLPRDITEKIYQYALQAECDTTLNGTVYTHTYSERHELEERLKTPLVTSYVKDLSKLDVATNLENDSLVHNITHKFMNGPPWKINSLLWWSYVNTISDADRLKANQTINYHYDLEGYQFIYFNFYITDVDDDSGPHVAVKGSHRKKHFSQLLGSANQPDEIIEKQYGKENIVVFTEKAGYGFIEDTFCYHKAVPPRKKERLMLQIRMSC